MWRILLFTFCIAALAACTSKNHVCLRSNEIIWSETFRSPANWETSWGDSLEGALSGIEPDSVLVLRSNAVDSAFARVAYDTDRLRFENPRYVGISVRLNHISGRNFLFEFTWSTYRISINGHELPEQFHVCLDTQDQAFRVTDLQGKRLKDIEGLFFLSIVDVPVNEVRFEAYPNPVAEGETADPSEINIKEVTFSVEYQ